MNASVLPWILLALFGLGLYLVAFQAADLAADLARGLAGLLRRRFQPVALRRLKELQAQAGVQAAPGGKRKSGWRLTLLGLSQWRPFWVAAALLAALVAADRLRSPLALAVVLAGGELYRSAQRARRMQRLNEDAGNLIVQFTSRYPLSRSLVRTLRDVSAALPGPSSSLRTGGEVRSAVEDSLRRLGMNQEPDRALESLRALRYPALERFARLLAVAQDTNREVFLKTLEILRREVEGRLDLGRQARQSLTLVRGTTRLLQAVAVTAMAVASVLPNWRAYFMAGFQHWLLFAGMLTVTLLSSFYMEAELRQLEV